MNNSYAGPSFTGKKVFVTGGSRGIGRCISRMFAEAGADVVAPARAELDLSSRESIRAYLDRYGRMDADVFVHCAGLNRLAGIDRIDETILDQVFQVNLYSATALLKAMAPHMAEQRWGRIVLISSLYSIVSREGRIAYSTSKNALTGLAKTLTLELAPSNVLTNCVAPGYVLTDMTRQNLSEQEIKDIEAKIPTGRFQSEEEIANLTLFLCSDLNQSITGQLIAVDGGFICQ